MGRCHRGGEDTGEELGVSLVCFGVFMSWLVLGVNLLLIFFFCSCCFSQSTILYRIFQWVWSMR